MLRLLNRIRCLIVGHDYRWLYAPDLEPCAIQCRRCKHTEDKPTEWFIQQGKEAMDHGQRG